MSKSSIRLRTECLKQWITFVNILKPKTKKVVKPQNEEEYE